MLSAALAGYRETLEVEAAAGRVSARRQYVEVAGQIRGWTGQEGAAGDYFDNLVAAAPEGMHDQLAEVAARASASYAAFGHFAETDLAARGRETDGVGRDRYALESRYFLGAEVDLEETYLWGWEELRRIEDDMAGTAQRIVSGGSVDDAVKSLDLDPARDCGSREAFEAWMQEKADSVLASFNGVHFDIAEPAPTIACKVAPINDGGAWYTPPSEDFARPGTMWFSFTDDQERFSTWRETTPVFHEGVPGHHLQCAQVVHRADLLNRWQRLLKLGQRPRRGMGALLRATHGRAGYFADPGDRLGFLDMQGFRAARVIVDIGVHLGLTIPTDNPYGWRPGEVGTPRGCSSSCSRTRGRRPGRSSSKVNRYLGWPGQAPSYKVGERIWLQARDQVRADKGAGFDLKEFHTAALNLGSIGLDPLKYRARPTVRARLRRRAIRRTPIRVPRWPQPTSLRRLSARGERHSHARGSLRHVGGGATSCRLAR